MAINENEYLMVTNRVKISMALTILMDVLPGQDYGITQQELSEITSRLGDAEEKLFSLYKTK